MTATGTWIKARISLVSTEEGGRAEPILAGTSYRPNHSFFDDNEMAVGFIELQPEQSLVPGGSLEIVLMIWPWERVERELAPGRRWRIQEGHRVIGHGEVLEVLGDAAP